MRAVGDVSQVPVAADTHLMHTCACYSSFQCFLVLELHSHLLLLLADTWLQDQQATHQRNEMMVRASMLACLLSQVISVPTSS